MKKISKNKLLNIISKDAWLGKMVSRKITGEEISKINYQLNEISLKCYTIIEEIKDIKEKLKGEKDD